MKRIHLQPMNEVQNTGRKGERDGLEFAPLNPHLPWQVQMEAMIVTWI